LRAVTPSVRGLLLFAQDLVVVVELVVRLLDVAKIGLRGEDAGRRGNLAAEEVLEST
jgi:hypothetical protein